MDDLHKVFEYAETNLVDIDTVSNNKDLFVASVRNWAIMRALERSIQAHDDAEVSPLTGIFPVTTLEAIECLLYELDYDEQVSKSEYGIFGFGIAYDEILKMYQFVKGDKK